MPTFRLDIAYDGTDFSGWAIQPGKRTVQGELADALARVLGEPTRLIVAGRTDAGVHALGQVASFVSEREVPGTLRRALNALTGRDLGMDFAGLDGEVTGAEGGDAAEPLFHLLELEQHPKLTSVQETAAVGA